MKRNIFQQVLADCSRPVTLTLLLASGLLAACNDDMADKGQSGALAEGDYPVTLTAVVEAATRATYENSWNGEEQVAVQVRKSTETWEQAAEAKTYQADSEGNLTSADPFWWTDIQSDIHVRAWYGGDGSTAKEGANATAVPTSWTVQADQSNANSVQQSDLLFAPEKQASFNGESAVPLTFYHQTAKVVVNIKQDETITSDDMITGVVLGEKNLSLSGIYAVPVEADAKYGTWTAATESNGTIQMLQLAEPTKEGYVASYVALAIPQTTANKRLIGVTLGSGKTLYYTAPADAQAFAAGKMYTYNITVDGSNLKVVATSGAWADGAIEQITSREVVGRYTDQDIKMGDYFYSDGTTSDGGLRVLYSDATYEMEAEKPAPVDGKTVVGIVFQTDPARIGEAEKEKLGGNCKGLVMALKNASADKLAWGPKNDVAEATDCASLAANYNDISGYAICQAIKTLDESLESYPAFKAVVDYNTTCAVPETTTGWFLPSAGQWWDIIRSLGGCSELTDLKIQGDTAEKSEYTLEVASNPINAMNSWMELIDDNDKNEFMKAQHFSTSTERNEDRPSSWELNERKLYLKGYQKTTELFVRPILAF